MGALERDLEGRVAVVTGAARGIGRGIALGLARAGADVVVSDLAAGGDTLTYALSDKSALEAVAGEIESLGVRSRALACDVTRAQEVEALMAGAREAFGRIDVLVNNAGVVHFDPLVSFDEARWDLLFDVNVKGVFLCCRAAIPSLIEQRGAIVNIASVAGKRGYAGGTGYCSSKFAVVGLTQALAAELGPQDVRVNAVCPGILATHMWTHHLTSEERGGRAAYEATVAQRIPLGREQTADDIAEAVLYLVRAPNVTGIALNVAGGMESW